MPLRISGMTMRERSSARVMPFPSLRRAAAPPLGVDADDVVDADDEMDHAEAGDETADERVVHPHTDGQVVVQQRIHRPHPRPRHDGEEETRLQTVEGK